MIKNNRKKVPISFGSLKIMPTFASQSRKNRLPNAKIAQLVEHNLAKVGVAGSSPVFRSRVQ